MFFDYSDEYDVEDYEEDRAKRPDSLIGPPPTAEESANKAVEKGKGKWRRVERRIYSPFWRAIHNLVAHPMLAIYRPWGELLHEWTARKMYEPRGKLSPIVTSND